MYFYSVNISSYASRHSATELDRRKPRGVIMNIDVIYFCCYGFMAWNRVDTTSSAQTHGYGQGCPSGPFFLIVLHTLSLQLEELSFGPYFIRKYNFGRLICAMADERTNRQRYVTIEAQKYVLREAADIIETSKSLMVGFGMSCYLLAKWSPRRC